MEIDRWTERYIGYLYVRIYTDKLHDASSVRVTGVLLCVSALYSLIGVCVCPRNFPNSVFFFQVICFHVLKVYFVTNVIDIMYVDLPSFIWKKIYIFIIIL